MSKQPFPLQLSNYFFTHQEATANPEHEINQSKESNAHYDINAVVSKINDRNSYGLEVTATLNPEKSVNAPYFIKITAFGIIEASDAINQKEIEKLVSSAGSQLMIGAIRERIAEMTSRGPWPANYINFIQL